MSAELMKSKFVRRPSVCGIDYLWSYCMDYFQILVVASPGQYAQTFFSFLKKKKFFNFLWIFFVFVNMGPYGSKNFKTLLLLQITAESFQTFPEFSSQWSSQNYIWDFWNFENWNFNEFYLFSLTWDPMGVKISKRYFSYKLQPRVLKLVLNFPPNVPHKTTVGIGEILSFRFFTIFFRKF